MWRPPDPLQGLGVPVHQLFEALKGVRVLPEHSHRPRCIASRPTTNTRPRQACTRAQRLRRRGGESIPPRRPARSDASRSRHHPRPWRTCGMGMAHTHTDPVRFLSARFYNYNLNRLPGQESCSASSAGSRPRPVREHTAATHTLLAAALGGPCALPSNKPSRRFEQAFEEAFECAPLTTSRLHQHPPSN